MKGNISSNFEILHTFPLLEGRSPKCEHEVFATRVARASEPRTRIKLFSSYRIKNEFDFSEY